MDDQNVALRRALSVGADLRTRDRAKLSIAQIDHLALMDEIDRLRGIILAARRNGSTPVHPDSDHSASGDPK